MHRSNFRRNGAAVGPFKMDMPVVQPSSEPKREREREPVRAINYAVKQNQEILEALEAQLAIFDRMEESVARMRDAVVAISERVNQKSDGLAQQVSELKSCVLALGHALKGHIGEVSGELHKSLNPRGDFDAIRQALKALGELRSIAGAQKGHSDALARLAISGSASKRSLEQNKNSIMNAIFDLSNKLDDAAKQKPKSRGKDSVLAEIRAYMNADKKVIRDDNGDIVGWKQATGDMN